MSRRRRKNRQEQRSIQNPAIPLSSANILKYLGAGLATSSGEPVSAQRALTYSPVWAAVSLISNDVGRLPFITYRREGKNKERATGHQVYRLLRRSVGDQTSNLWLIRMVGHAALYGNSYSRILRDRLNRIVGLEWVHSDEIIPAKENGIRYYKYQPYRGGGERIPAIDVFHLSGLVLDELGGLSLVQFARNTIGRQLAAEGFSDDFFLNHGVPSGWFTHPATMSEEAQQRFLQNVKAAHAGAGRRFNPGILEEGMKWENSGITPEDALLVESLQWGVKDVSRFFSIPPHKLGDDSKVSYNSLEQEDKAYFGSTLGSWISRLEYEANDKLFDSGEQESGEVFAEFLQDSWLKADIGARYSAYAIGRQWGWLSSNDIRAFENLNPIEGGDEYLTPLTHGTPQAVSAVPLPAAKKGDDRSRVAMRDVLVDRLGAAVRLIGSSANRAVRKPREFLKWVDNLSAKHGDAIRGIVGPAARAVGAEGVADQLLSRAVDALLVASECREEDLAEHVRSAIEGLAQAIPEFADQFFFEKVE